MTDTKNIADIDDTDTVTEEATNAEELQDQDDDKKSQKSGTIRDAVLLFFITLSIMYTLLKVTTINGGFLDFFYVGYVWPYITIFGSFFVIIIVDVIKNQLTIAPFFEEKNTNFSFSYIKKFTLFPFFIFAIIYTHYNFYETYFNRAIGDSIGANFNKVSLQLSDITAKNSIVSPNIRRKKIISSLNLFPQGEKEYYKALIYFYPFIRQFDGEDNRVFDRINKVNIEVLQTTIREQFADYESHFLVTKDDVSGLKVDIWKLYKKPFFILNRVSLPLFKNYWDKLDKITDQENFLLWQISVIESLRNDKLIIDNDGKVDNEKIKELYTQLLKQHLAFQTTDLYRMLILKLLVSIHSKELVYDLMAEEDDLYSMMRVVLKNTQVKAYLQDCADAKDNPSCIELLNY